jgi:hypothetical protein
MARYQSELQRREAEQFKSEMVEILHGAQDQQEGPEVLKQETIADAVGTTQPTVSRWFSYREPEFPDLFQFSKFPPAILVPIANLILKPLGLTVTRPKPAIHELDGSTDGEMLKVDVWQGKLIEEKDPRRKKVLIEKMRRELDKAEAECDAQITTTVSTPS